MSIVNTPKDRLYETVAAVLGVPPTTLGDESSPETIKTWDSLNHLQLVMALEAAFSISLTPEDVVDMRNLGLVRTILRDYGVDC